MKTHPMRKLRRGFTLTELLVVIVILAVLIALSVTGMKRVRDYADRVGSTRNLAQLQIANASYAADHSGMCVPLYATDNNGARTGFWFQDRAYLAYLIGNVPGSDGQQTRIVPSSLLDPKVFRAGNTMSHSIAASYGMNDNGLMARTGPDVRAAHYFNRVSDPARSMAFSTSTDYRVTYGSRFNWDGVDAKTSDGAMAYRYRDRALIVYFDGHVGEISMDELREIDRSRRGRSSHFWTPTQN